MQTTQGQTHSQTVKSLPCLSKLRKRAAEMSLSLLNEGYRVVTQSNACEAIVLRHCTNGNWIQIQCTNMGVLMYKNGLLKKIELL